MLLIICFLSFSSWEIDLEFLLMPLTSANCWACQFRSFYFKTSSSKFIYFFIVLRLVDLVGGKGEFFVAFGVLFASDEYSFWNDSDLSFFEAESLDGVRLFDFGFWVFDDLLDVHFLELVVVGLVMKRIRQVGEGRVGTFPSSGSCGWPGRSTSREGRWLGA